MSAIKPDHPAPWRIDDGRVFDASGVGICELEVAEDDSAALLIRAAPEMAAMLRDVLEEIDDPDGRLGSLRQRMKEHGLRDLLDRIDKAAKAG